MNNYRTTWSMYFSYAAPLFVTDIHKSVMTVLTGSDKRSLTLAGTDLPL